MIDLVVVDIGNSKIKCGLFQQGNLTDTWHCSNYAAEMAAKVLVEKSGKLPIALASVAPTITAIISDYLTVHNKKFVELKTNSQQIITGIYETMGIDRIANAAAAWKLYGNNFPVFVLDFGTATTATAISATGQFSGGLITLGLNSTLSAISKQMAQLPQINLDLNEISAPISKLGFDTKSATIQGTILAHIAMIEKWTALGKNILGQSTIIVATGGWSKFFSDFISIFDYVDPQLTLKGTYLLACQAEDLMDQV